MVVLGIEPGTSGSVARNSDHYKFTVHQEGQLLEMKHSKEIIHQMYTDLGEWQVKHQVGRILTDYHSLEYTTVLTGLSNKPVQQVMMMP
jgi:hypothetical protein